MVYQPKGNRKIQRYFGQPARLETEFSSAFYKEVWGQRITDLENHIGTLNKLLTAAGQTPPTMTLGKHDADVEKLTKERDNAIAERNAAQNALTAYINKISSGGGVSANWTDLGNDFNNPWLIKAWTDAKFTIYEVKMLTDAAIGGLTPWQYDFADWFKNKKADPKLSVFDYCKETAGNKTTLLTTYNTPKTPDTTVYLAAWFETKAKKYITFGKTDITDTVNWATWKTDFEGLADYDAGVLKTTLLKIKDDTKVLGIDTASKARWVEIEDGINGILGINPKLEGLKLALQSEIQNRINQYKFVSPNIEAEFDVFAAGKGHYGTTWKALIAAVKNEGKDTGGDKTFLENAKSSIIYGFTEFMVDTFIKTVPNTVGQTRLREYMKKWTTSYDAPVYAAEKTAIETFIGKAPITVGLWQQYLADIGTFMNSTEGNDLAKIKAWATSKKTEWADPLAEPNVIDLDFPNGKAVKDYTDNGNTSSTGTDTIVAGLGTEFADYKPLRAMNSGSDGNCFLNALSIIYTYHDLVWALPLKVATILGAMIKPEDFWDPPFTLKGLRERMFDESHKGVAMWFRHGHPGWCYNEDLRYVSKILQRPLVCIYKGKFVDKTGKTVEDWTTFRVDPNVPWITTKLEPVVVIHVGGSHFEPLVGQLTPLADKKTALETAFKLKIDTHFLKNTDTTLTTKFDAEATVLTALDAFVKEPLNVGLDYFNKQTGWKAYFDAINYRFGNTPTGFEVVEFNLNKALTHMFISYVLGEAGITGKKAVIEAYITANKTKGDLAAYNAGDVKQADGAKTLKKAMEDLGIAVPTN